MVRGVILMNDAGQNFTGDHRETSETATSNGSSAATVRVLGCPVPKWARWPAVLAFLFFLVKGLIWLALLAVGVRSVSGG